MDNIMDNTIYKLSEIKIFMYGEYIFIEFHK